MSIKLEINGLLGKAPYVQTIGDVSVTVISVACRRGSSRHADWVTGTIWDKRLADYVQTHYKKGDKIQAFGVLGKCMVYYSGDGKAHAGMDMFVNAIGTAHPEREVKNEHH